MPGYLSTGSCMFYDSCYSIVRNVDKVCVGSVGPAQSASLEKCCDGRRKGISVADDPWPPTTVTRPPTTVKWEGCNLRVYAVIHSKFGECVFWHYTNAAGCQDYSIQLSIQLLGYSTIHTPAATLQTTNSGQLSQLKVLYHQYTTLAIATEWYIQLVHCTLASV